MKRVIISMLALAAMTSCQKADEQDSFVNPAEPQEILLTAGVTRVEAATKAAIADEFFPAGTTLGLYAITEGTSGYTWGTDLAYNNNGKVSVDADKNINIATTESTPIKIYYPTDNKHVKFFAYYPTEGATVTPPSANISAKVQYTITGKEDIMFAQAESGTLSTYDKSQKVALKFDHLLAKINFTVKAGDNFSGGSLTKIEVAGSNTTVKMDVDDGSLKFENLTTINAFNDEKDPKAITTTETAAFGEVMIEPGCTYSLNLTVEGVVYTLTNLTAPAKGQAKTVQLTFLGSEVSAQAAITAWGTPDNDPQNVQK